MSFRDQIIAKQKLPRVNNINAQQALLKLLSFVALLMH